MSDFGERVMVLGVRVIRYRGNCRMRRWGGGGGWWLWKRGCKADSDGKKESERELEKRMHLLVGKRFLFH